MLHVYEKLSVHMQYFVSLASNCSACRAASPLFALAPRDQRIKLI